MRVFCPCGARRRLERSAGLAAGGSRNRLEVLWPSQLVSAASPVWSSQPWRSGVANPAAGEGKPTQMESRGSVTPKALRMRWRGGMGRCCTSIWRVAPFIRSRSTVRLAPWEVVAASSRSPATTVAVPLCPDGTRRRMRLPHSGRPWARTKAW